MSIKIQNLPSYIVAFKNRYCRLEGTLPPRMKAVQLIAPSPRLFPSAEVMRGQDARLRLCSASPNNSYLSVSSIHSVSETEV